MNILKKIWDEVCCRHYCEQCGKVVWTGKVQYISFWTQKYTCDNCYEKRT